MCISPEQLNCVSTINFETNELKCLTRCDGMDIISYNEHHMKEEENKRMELEELYHKYKRPYKFLSKPKFKSNNILIWFYILYVKLIISDFQFKSKLHYIQVYFDIPKFDRITKDRAAKFVDMLSAIGGTMGLLTGFSLISAVEIVYFSAKLMVGFIKKKRFSNSMFSGNWCSYACQWCIKCPSVGIEGGSRIKTFLVVKGQK